MEEPKQKIKLTPGNPNPKPKGRRGLSRAENAQKRENNGEFEYVFKDAATGNFNVKKTANAWWKDKMKLEKLIAAYKIFATDDQACFYAGITIDQLIYFQEIHPEFYRIKHACKQMPSLKAKQTITGALGTNPALSQWWLERTEKETFSPRVENTGGNGRDLFDSLTEQVRSLGEKLRKDDRDTKEHTPVDEVGDNVAGPDGIGNETATATAEVGAQDVPASAGQIV
jgi:hypothetical protein